MYTQVATALDVAAGSTAYSQAVSMDVANAVQVNVVVINNTASTDDLSISVEGSNDLENWDAQDITGSAIAFDDGAIGYATSQFYSIAYAYVRLKYSMTGSTAQAIVSAGINTAHR